MTRRLLTAISLTAVVTGGLVIATAPAASAYDDGIICVGGPNQREQNRYTGVCVGPQQAEVYP